MPVLLSLVWFMGFHQITIGLTPEGLHFLIFGFLPGNICCHGNTLDIFGLSQLQSLNPDMDCQKNFIIGLAQEALHIIGLCLLPGNNCCSSFGEHNSTTVCPHLVSTILQLCVLIWSAQLYSCVSSFGWQNSTAAWPHLVGTIP